MYQRESHAGVHIKQGACGTLSRWVKQVIALSLYQKGICDKKHCLEVSDDLACLCMWGPGATAAQEALLHAKEPRVIEQEKFQGE